MRFLFLYTEVAGYFLSAVRALTRNANVEVHVVHWPVHRDAPFDLSAYPFATLYDRSRFSDGELRALCASIRPDVLFASGWQDRTYCAAALDARAGGATTVCMVDTQWKGTLRQRTRMLLGGAYVRRCFEHAWVAGLYQYEFARRLGYPRDRIRTGMYTADVEPFSRAYERSLDRKRAEYPHVLLYTGRFHEEKGTDVLYAAFRRVRERGFAHWRLRMVGKGPQRASMATYEGLEMLDFVQPSDVPHLVSEAGVFVLPSRRDAWGVAMHECAAAGLPIVSSDAAGATTAFVRESYNGELFKAGDEHSLARALERMFVRTDDELREMGRRSHELAMQITPETWAATAVSFAGPTPRPTSLAMPETVPVHTITGEST
jgi:glycosyltransferase involved in cell wall biosynthesis